MKDFIEDTGVQISLILAGMAGAYVSISVNSNLTRWQKAAVMVAGALTANYLTPLVAYYLGLGAEVRYGLAFLVGFSGLKAVEWMIVYLRSKFKKDE